MRPQFYADVKRGVRKERCPEREVVGKERCPEKRGGRIGEESGKDRWSVREVSGLERCPD